MLPRRSKCAHIKYNKEKIMNHTTYTTHTYFIKGNQVTEAEFYEYKNKQKEKTMTDNNTKPTILHLAQRRQWLDDMEKDPTIVWQFAYKHKPDNWQDVMNAGGPQWCEECNYRRKPKTKTYYMVMVKHTNYEKLPPFSLTFSSEQEITPYINQLNLAQIGDIVPREVEE